MKSPWLHVLDLGVVSRGPDHTSHRRLPSTVLKVTPHLFYKVENNSLELTRIFKESFRDQR